MPTIYVTMYAEMTLPDGKTMYMKYHADTNSIPDKNDADGIKKAMAAMCETTLDLPEGSVSAKTIPEEEYFAATEDRQTTDIYARQNDDGTLSAQITRPQDAVKRCPKCGSTRFIATAHVTQDWVLDTNGNFEKTLNDCVEVTHAPDEDDIWTCAECGYDAPGSEFNNAD